MDNKLFSLKRWLRSYLANYSVAQWYYTTIVFLSLIVLVWYTILYRPINKSISRLSQRVNQTKLKIDDEGNWETVRTTLTTRNAGLQRNFQAYTHDKYDENTIMIELTNRALASSLAITNCSLGGTHEHNWFKIQPVTIKVQGSLHNFTQWLNNLTDFRLLHITQLNITHEAKDKFTCTAVFEYVIL